MEAKAVGVGGKGSRCEEALGRYRAGGRMEAGEVGNAQLVGENFDEVGGGE